VKGPRVKERDTGTLCVLTCDFVSCDLTLIVLSK